MGPSLGSEHACAIYNHVIMELSLAFEHNTPRSVYWKPRRSILLLVSHASPSYEKILVKRVAPPLPDTLTTLQSALVQLFVIAFDSFCHFLQSVEVSDIYRCHITLAIQISKRY